MYGYMGKVLRIGLSNKRVFAEPLKGDILKKVYRWERLWRMDFVG
jgi:aldehyde:ferredoxin oxidoreductase